MYQVLTHSLLSRACCLWLFLSASLITLHSSSLVLLRLFEHTDINQIAEIIWILKCSFVLKGLCLTQMAEVTHVYGTTHIHSNWYNNVVLKHSVVGGTSSWVGRGENGVRSFWTNYLLERMCWATVSNLSTYHQQNKFSNCDSPITGFSCNIFFSRIPSIWILKEASSFI